MSQMENQNQEYGLAQRELAVKSLDVYNDIIASREYIAGERFTYADIQMVTSLQFLVRLNKLDLKDYINLNEYINQVSSKPSFSSWLNLPLYLFTNYRINNYKMQYRSNWN